MFVTQYGAQLGDAIYLLISKQNAYLLSFLDVTRIPELTFIPSSMLTDDERTLCWDAWKNRNLVLDSPMVLSEN